MKFLAPIALLSSVLLVACGPGVRDGETPISGEYYYVDTGGDGRYVLRRQAGSKGVFVISARVDKVLIDDQRILVARRPRITVPLNDGTATSRIEPVCEFWTIDLESHRITRLQDPEHWPDLKCWMNPEN